MVRSASYLGEHWKGDMTPLLVFGDEEKANNMKKKYLLTMSLKEYIQGENQVEEYERGRYYMTNCKGRGRFYRTRVQVVGMSR